MKTRLDFLMHLIWLILSTASGVATMIVADNMETCRYRIDILMSLHSALWSALMIIDLLSLNSRCPERNSVMPNGKFTLRYLLGLFVVIVSVFPELYFSIKMGDLCARMPPLKVRIFIYCFTGLYCLTSVFCFVRHRHFIYTSLPTIIKRMRHRMSLRRMRAINAKRAFEMVTKDCMMVSGWRRYIEESQSWPSRRPDEELVMPSHDMMFYAIFTSRRVRRIDPNITRSPACFDCKQNFQIGEVVCCAPDSQYLKFYLKHRRCYYSFEMSRAEECTLQPTHTPKSIGQLEQFFSGGSSVGTDSMSRRSSELQMA